MITTFSVVMIVDVKYYCIHL